MKGKLPFRIRNAHIEFRFELERNVTILTGDSGTGKTKLIRMVSDYADLGKSSGVTLTCNRPCVVLSGANWETILEKTKESVVFVDEGTPFLTSYDFAKSIIGSDNYYVFVSREPLPQIAYSIEAINRIEKKGKKPKLRKLYDKTSVKDIASFPYDLVIVEDSKSGFQFFRKATESLSVECITAGGKSGFLPLLKQNAHKRILVVADAAAFGSEIHDLLYYKENSGSSVDFFLPESFEWMILKSGIYSGDAGIQSVLQSPADHIESREFFSWERFFTHLLVEESQGKPGQLHYTKSSIAPGYCTGANIADILGTMK